MLAISKNEYNAHFRVKIDKNGSARPQKRPQISGFTIRIYGFLIETG